MNRHSELRRTVQHLSAASGSGEVGEALARGAATIVLSEEAVSCPAGQALAVTLARLVPRYCARVRFTGPRGPALPHLQGLLGDTELSPASLAGMAQSIWLDGEFTDVPGRASRATVIGVGSARGPVHLGIGIQEGCVATACPGTRVGIHEPDATLTGLVAAGLGSAAAVRHIYPSLFGSAPGPVYLNEGPFGGPLEPPESRDLARPYLVGVGAVGCATLYALACLDARGEIVLVDPDRIDDTNLMRYILFDSGDVGRLKVEAAAKRMPSNLTVNCVPTVLKEHLRQTPRERNRLSILMSAVDSYAARRALAEELPRQILNAGTSATDFTVSRHGLGDGNACLACLYPSAKQSSTESAVMARELGLSEMEVDELLASKRPLTSDQLERIAAHRHESAEQLVIQCSGQPLDSLYHKHVCGTQPLRTDRGEVFAPLAHGSALAGFLLAHALLTSDSWAESSTWFRTDVAQALEAAALRERKRPVKGCWICSDRDYRDLYRERWG